MIRRQIWMFIYTILLSAHLISPASALTTDDPIFMDDARGYIVTKYAPTMEARFPGISTEVAREIARTDFYRLILNHYVLNELKADVSAGPAQIAEQEIRVELANQFVQLAGALAMAETKIDPIMEEALTRSREGMAIGDQLMPQLVKAVGLGNVIGSTYDAINGLLTELAAAKYATGLEAARRGTMTFDQVLDHVSDADENIEASMAAVVKYTEWTGAMSLLGMLTK